MTVCCCVRGCQIRNRYVWRRMPEIEDCMRERRFVWNKFKIASEQGVMKVKGEWISSKKMGWFSLT